MKLCLGDILLHSTKPGENVKKKLSHMIRVEEILSTGCQHEMIEYSLIFRPSNTTFKCCHSP